MTPAVAAVLADRPLAARLALAVVPEAGTGSCATPTCAHDREIGHRYCDPCRAERKLERHRRWWAENGAAWRAGRTTAA